MPFRGYPNRMKFEQTDFMGIFEAGAKSLSEVLEKSRGLSERADKICAMCADCTGRGGIIFSCGNGGGRLRNFRRRRNRACGLLDFLNIFRDIFPRALREARRRKRNIGPHDDRHRRRRGRTAAHDICGRKIRRRKRRARGSFLRLPVPRALRVCVRRQKNSPANPKPVG